jgi:hypothetical protein
METPRADQEPQVPRWRRVGLAFGSLMLVWFFYTVFLMLYGGLEIIPLSAWTGFFIIATFVIYVVPLVVLCRVSFQLRHWYVMLALSILWTVGIFSLFFHMSPTRLFHGQWLPILAIAFAAASTLIYLALLGRMSSRG